MMTAVGATTTCSMVIRYVCFWPLADWQLFSSGGSKADIQIGAS